MHYTAWSLEWIPSLPYAQHLDSKVPVNGQHLMWDLSVTELLVIKKIRNWGTLEKLPNRQVRHQCLWVTAEIKCSALFKYETFWIKLYLIIWILYLRKLSWMFCSPIGRKTNALTWEWLSKMLQRLYVCTHSLYLDVYIYMYLQFILLSERRAKRKWNSWHLKVCLNSSRGFIFK